MKQASMVYQFQSIYKKREGGLVKELDFGGGGRWWRGEDGKGERRGWVGGGGGGVWKGDKGTM